MYLPPVDPSFLTIHSIEYRCKLFVKCLTRLLLVFISSWLLPLQLLFVLLLGNELLFGTKDRAMRRPSFLGISETVLITNPVASILIIMLASRYLHPQED